MANLTRVEIITPASVKFAGEVEWVVAPGSAGDLAALAHHAPLLTTLRTGVVSAKTSSERVQFAIDSGFMEILADKVLILADMALSRDEVNVEDARADLRRAEEELAQKRGGDDAVQRRAVAWARARLEVTSRPV